MSEQSISLSRQEPTDPVLFRRSVGSPRRTEIRSRPFAGERFSDSPRPDAFPFLASTPARGQGDPALERESAGHERPPPEETGQLTLDVFGERLGLEPHDLETRTACGEPDRGGAEMVQMSRQVEPAPLPPDPGTDQ